MKFNWLQGEVEEVQNDDDLQDVGCAWCEAGDR